MKKGLVIGFVLCLVLGAAKPPTNWKDLLTIKPSGEWFDLYGYSDTSWLAYDAWVQKQLIDGQGAVLASVKKEITELKARVAALETADPNEVEE